MHDLSLSSSAVFGEEDMKGHSSGKLRGLRGARPKYLPLPLREREGTREAGRVRGLSPHPTAAAAPSPSHCFSQWAPSSPARGEGYPTPWTRRGCDTIYRRWLVQRPSHMTLIT